jgi:prolyl-tRNA synthetase
MARLCRREHHIFSVKNFAKAFDVTYVNKENTSDYVWATSWGVSTRLIGALVMAHSDDDGLILPPKLAPIQVVIVPIYKGDESKPTLNAKGMELANALKAKGIKVKFDNDDNSRPGWKFAEYEMKGVPVRVALGMRDLENNVAEVARRDTKEKTTLSLDGLPEAIENLLHEIQSNIHQKALSFRNENITPADTWKEFEELLDTKGGFISAHWDGTPETEEEIKTKTKATIRCIPLNNKQEEGKCILTGKASSQRVLFARAY